MNLEPKTSNLKPESDALHRFDGLNAIVTGSTSGVGEAAARLLAHRGAAGVLITGRNPERGKQVAEDLNVGACTAAFVQADLADPDACGRIFDGAREAFGPIHILVNAAGLSTRGSIYDTSVALWDHLMAVNVRAPFILTQAAVKHMREHGIEGSIVNVLSVVHEGGPAFLCPYSTSKGALATFTKNVAYAVMRHRIRVNGLLLGWTDTPTEDVIQRTEHGEDTDWLDRAESRLPFGRLIKPEECARAIAWLASAESGMMTGALMHFDQSVAGAGYVPQPQPGEMGTA